MTWNRFDICAAWYCIAHDYGLYDKRTQLDRMSFNPGVSLMCHGYGALTPNGIEHYNHIAEGINMNSCNTVREELREGIEDYGVTVNDTGMITDLGKFGGQPVDIVYFHRAYMMGDTGTEDASFDDGEGWNAYTIDEYERDVFGLDAFAEEYAILSFDSQGFIGLEYVSEEELQELIRVRDEYYEQDEEC